VLRNNAAQFRDHRSGSRVFGGWQKAQKPISADGACSTDLSEVNGKTDCGGGHDSADRRRGVCGKPKRESSPTGMSRGALEAGANRGSPSAPVPEHARLIVLLCDYVQSQPGHGPKRMPSCSCAACCSAAIRPTNCRRNWTPLAAAAGIGLIAARIGIEVGRTTMGISCGTRMVIGAHTSRNRLSVTARQRRPAS